MEGAIAWSGRHQGMRVEDVLNQEQIEGKKIVIYNGKIAVPDRPIIPYIEGDGTGADIWRATRPVLDAAVEKAYNGQRKIAWLSVPAGEEAYKTTGEHLPESTLRAIREHVVTLKGPLTTPIGGGFRSLNVTIRQKLDLYACVRPVKWYEGVPSPVRNPQHMDVVIFRENTEDVYAGYEWRAGSSEAQKLIYYLNKELDSSIPADSGIGIKFMSENASKRLIRKAITFALENGRKSVTLVHKGNIMKYTEGSFKEWGYQVAIDEFGGSTVTEETLMSQYDGKLPEGKIVIKDRIADNMFQQILTRTHEYDVLAMPNLNGDYFSDACAAQAGGLGIAPGANIGDFVAVFEATHGSAPKYAGMDVVNPGSLILSGALMLDHINWTEAACLVREGFADAIRNKTVTYDLARSMEGSRKLSTSEFGKTVVNHIFGNRV
jgi:isocitrate dehydrogenase